MLESQKVLLQLIKELDEICKKNNIVYYLIGGSALGAVRHHGFIPWDDDMDIVMDHENYMKFVEVMSDPANLPPNRAYEDPFIEPHTQLNIFGRYSATNTTCIFDYMCFCDVKHGIKVDVFHLIPCPDEGEERDEFLEKYQIWAELCHPWARYRKMSAAVYKASIEETYKLGIKEVRQRLFDDLHIEKYADSLQYIYCYEKLHIFYNKDVFQEPVYFPFEDTYLPVPTKYAEHFRVLFGDDWYCIPDTEEQITHPVALDYKRGYEEYTSDYLSYALSEQEELYQEHKHKTFEVWEKQNEAIYIQAELRKPLIERKMEFFWSEFCEQIRKAFQSGNYAEVLEIAEPYLDEQLKPYAIRWSLFFRIDKEMFKYVLFSLLYLSKNKSARRILEISDDDYKNSEIEEVRTFLQKKDHLVMLEEEKADRDNLFKENERLLSLHPGDKDLQLRKALMLLDDSSIQGSEIKDICSKHSEDGMFIAVLAKLAEKCGQAEEASKLYEKAIVNTNNGLVILESKLSLERINKQKVEVI